jgi:peptidoglycan-associated lipoprotein
MKSTFAQVILYSLLLITSCSSTKKNNADGVDSLTGGNKVAELKLGGDSDNTTAGGLSTVYFDLDSAQLSASSQSALTANAEYLNKNNTVKIQIEGHCDDRGGVQYNLALSEKRAKSVKDFLKALGVSESRMTVIGYGKEKPVDLAQTEDAWSKNRRANFSVTAL